MMVKRFSFKNFNIIRVTKIIGLYDDYKHQENNIFKDYNNKTIKKFKQFKVEIVLEPKEHKNAIINDPNCDIGDIVNKLHSDGYAADVMPFMKNNAIYYQLRDKSNLTINQFYIIFEDYYSWKEAKDYINTMIKNNNTDGLNVVYEDNNYFRNEFYIGKLFNYTDYII